MMRSWVNYHFLQGLNWQVFFLLIIIGYSFYCFVIPQPVVKDEVLEEENPKKIPSELISNHSENLLLLKTMISEVEQLKALVNSSLESKLTPLQGTTSKDDEVQMILLVTFWRSGSTWFGQLLDQLPQTFYVYEPAHILKGISFTNHEDLAIPEVFKESVIKGLFHCQLPTSFIHHMTTWSAFYTPKTCKRKNCTENDIAKECLNSKYRIAKTVRLSLADVEPMLMQPSLKNLKVIYLVRDPRATINSIKAHISKIEKWKITTNELCSRIMVDTVMFTELQKRFSDRLFFLRYEDIARNPFEKATEIWRFLKGPGEDSKILPPKWTSYLKKSEAVKKRNSSNPFDTYTKSTKEWQNWRSEISEGLLLDAERECSYSLPLLGYNAFGSLDRVRDFSLPILSVDYCANNFPCSP